MTSRVRQRVGASARHVLAAGVAGSPGPSCSETQVCGGGSGGGDDGGSAAKRLAGREGVVAIAACALCPLAVGACESRGVVPLGLSWAVTACLCVNMLCGLHCNVQGTRFAGVYRDNVVTGAGEMLGFCLLPLLLVAALVTATTAVPAAASAAAAAVTASVAAAGRGDSGEAERPWLFLWLCLAALTLCNSLLSAHVRQSRAAAWAPGASLLAAGAWACFGASADAAADADADGAWTCDRLPVLAVLSGTGACVTLGNTWAFVVVVAVAAYACVRLLVAAFPRVFSLSEAMVVGQLWAFAFLDAGLSLSLSVVPERVVGALPIGVTWPDSSGWLALSSGWDPAAAAAAAGPAPASLLGVVATGPAGRWQVHAAVQVLLTGAILACALMYVPVAMWRRFAGGRRAAAPPVSVSCACGACFAVAYAAFLWPWLSRLLLGQEPVLWVLGYIVDEWTRVMLLLYWLALVASSLLLLALFFLTGGFRRGNATAAGRIPWTSPLALARRLRHLTAAPSSGDPAATDSSGPPAVSLPTTVVRKYFHALAVCLFAPAIAADPLFVALAFAVAVALFLFIEFARAARLPPVAASVDRAFAPLIDERDSGALVLTHMYLLVGCAVPVWTAVATGGAQGTEESGPAAMLLYLAPFSGVLALGVGDSFASVVGRRYGRLRWTGTKKTVEGTLAAVASQFIACLLLWLAAATAASVRGGAPPFAVSSFAAVALASAAVLVATGATALLEAFTQHIDNLTLPIYLYATLAVLAAILRDVSL